MSRESIRCPKQWCGGTLEARVVEFGRVVYHCGNCARKKARLCKDCPARTPSPLHWRCTVCHKKARRERGRIRDRERYAKRRLRVIARWKARMQDPEFRAHRAEYMRKFREEHPRDDHDRAYQRAYMAACRANPEYVNK